MSWRERRDRGEFRISKEWQEFILKTYQEGNQGSRQMSPAQVAVRVKVRAQELGTEDYPSHMSVYRLLRSHNHLQVPTKRSRLMERVATNRQDQRRNRNSSRIQQSSLAGRPYKSRCTGSRQQWRNLRKTVANHSN